MDEQLLKKQKLEQLPLIVFFCDCTWSIGRVHRSIADALAHKYRFAFHHDANFNPEMALRDLSQCCLCISTPNVMTGVAGMMKRAGCSVSRLLLIFHGKHSPMNQILQNEDFDDVEFATISEAVVPEDFPKRIHFTPSAMVPDQFKHRERSGVINRVGWCGNAYLKTKRVDWAHQICSKTKLELSMALQLPFEKMQSWYDSIDILIVTAGPSCDAESGPLPPFEAIMCGVVAVGTRVGNFALVPGPKFGTIDEAAGLIKELQLDPQRMRQIAAEQYKFVMENFMIDSVSKRWDNVFQEYANKP